MTVTLLPYAADALFVVGVDVLTEGLLSKGVSCVGWGGAVTGVKAGAGVGAGVVSSTVAKTPVVGFKFAGKVG